LNTALMTGSEPYAAAQRTAERWLHHGGTKG
jgi:hypothetical protein